jgi:heptosyltransferase I
MDRVLIVKVTSLGDIVHAQPLVDDLRRNFPGVSIDWAADAAFAEVLRWNPGIHRVLCAPLRRFKSQRGLTDFKRIAASIAELRRVRYDAVIDVHGVYKSAIIAFLARARARYGYRSADLGEKGAAFAYSRRFARPAERNAWEGLRESVGQAFGYSIDTPPRFGLKIPAPAAIPAAARHGAFAILFHATSCDDKKWPLEHWQRLGTQLRAQGLRALLPWGSQAEHAEALAIAEGIPDALVLPRLSVLEIAQHIELASLIVGTDTGFVHLAAALRQPTVMIFTATSRRHFGVSLPGTAVSVGDEGDVPSVGAVADAVASVSLLVRPPPPTAQAPRTAASSIEV